MNWHCCAHDHGRVCQGFDSGTISWNCGDRWLLNSAAHGTMIADIEQTFHSSSFQLRPYLVRARKVPPLHTKRFVWRISFMKFQWKDTPPSPLPDQPLLVIGNACSVVCESPRHNMAGSPPSQHKAKQQTPAHRISRPWLQFQAFNWRARSPSYSEAVCCLKCAWGVVWLCAVLLEQQWW